MPMPTFFADFRLVAGATIARIRDAGLPRGRPRGLKNLLVVLSPPSGVALSPPPRLSARAERLPTVCPARSPRAILTR